MKRFLAAVMAVVVAAALAPSVMAAQSKCPPEVAQAKELLGRQSQAQPSRTLAGAQMKDIQAPRVSSKEIQAPRALAGAQFKDVQAPRVSGTGDVQAPRVSGTGDVQAPRVSGAGKSAGQSPSITSPAAKLVRDAETACKKGDMKTAKAKAAAAIAQLNK